MAIVARVTVEPADQDAHDRLQTAVETAMGQSGGPPDGLMVHVGHPSGRGFVIVEVWKSEDAFHEWWIEVLARAIPEVGLSAGAPEICPAWSVARP